MKNSKCEEKKNLLIYDKSTNIGCIYFIGISSNFYKGKMILKKNCVSDKIVRYTNLNDNLMLIRDGNYNFKQTAILIKGITIFLHRQLEVLLADFYSMYKRCLYSSLNTEYGINNNMKKYKTKKGMRIKKKLLCLQDGVGISGTNDMLINDKHNNKNKHISNINDLMLKEYNMYNNDYDYNFENIDMYNDDKFIYQDMLTRTSSFDYSKYNNFYTINNDMMNNLITKGGTGEIKMNLKMDKNTNDMLLKYNIQNGAANKNIHTNKHSNDNLFANRNIDTKNLSLRMTNDSFILNGNAIHMQNNKDLKNGNNININYKPKDSDIKNNNNNSKGKRLFAQIDEEILLKDSVWYDSKNNKRNPLMPLPKRKKGDTQFDSHLDNMNHFFYFFKNPFKNNSYNAIVSFNLYDQAKNSMTHDARKELYKTFEKKIIENEQNYESFVTSNGIQTQSTLSSHDDLKKKDKGERGIGGMYFEQIRGNINNDYFMDMELDNNEIKKMGYTKSSNNFYSNISDNIGYDFNKINSSEMNMQEKPFNLNDSYLDKANQSDKITHQNSLLQQIFTNSTFNDTSKETLSVPSSILIKRRSCTYSQNNYDKELLRIKNYLYKISDQNNDVIQLDKAFPLYQMSSKQISLVFYNLLVLASNEEINLNQKFPHKSIYIQVLHS
ncbi:conserved Plasmodium protein, unknown function [Plasmodium chabaudi chabaudi]|uniref:Uncharacterized protein n=1 Tax=Plasmodium chabaudi chabaudi TaxID=31271 RepID=A0A1D3S329_PLACU|nr:conserved Plasmodium protein, unknown function [Plasmodium chabaudi chabaudi]